ncbi:MULTISPECIES: metal/formaldehyde-sensitive transcriptional repressor [Acinetobacter]|jgi:FrmR/RcnR family transcriptional regulator, repressor of rcnA expression|uniref:Metal/formaldehyde-sensitive transcriptional repressor n=2 Tax=Acinetobacter johnsonii TaxID=40214 RepID=A0A239RZH9_ACIJO|nr:MULTISPECIES: metal/formaldehyde-sensitive transcriptional repressor [Acinetobacter]ECE6726630.1 metal/formaldehyde-sensitive transcriptional repressor [Salmonella enterica subsp. enterica serovar Paratyphi A]OHC23987.1 MAG: transcriptional repressor RcnR to maintain nickel and cobalt homeostasis [Pseudomonadales bacterium RIFCSPHIGHO2_12_FULL_40_16]ALV72945.1 transcriptional repressor RcnR to maintain nickel and cobalt homeostasis [Acinetobacter johnsonii XBB1]AXF45553.1 metal/formaldehyde-
MSHLNQNKKIMNRIKRIQGQTNAIEQNLLSENISCIEVLQQIAAVKGAITGLMNELIELHLREHVLSDLEKINEEDLNDFLALIKRYT